MEHDCRAERARSNEWRGEEGRRGGGDPVGQREAAVGLCLEAYARIRRSCERIGQWKKNQRWSHLEECELDWLTVTDLASSSTVRKLRIRWIAFLHTLWEKLVWRQFRSNNSLPLLGTVDLWRWMAFDLHDRREWQFVKFYWSYWKFDINSDAQRFRMECFIRFVSPSDLLIVSQGNKFLFISHRFFFY